MRYIGNGQILLVFTVGIAFTAWCQGGSGRAGRSVAAAQQSGAATTAPASTAGRGGRGRDVGGADRYRRGRQLLILADIGGSNSCRTGTWKAELQTQLCNSFGLTVTVAHYPTGVSK